MNILVVGSGGREHAICHLFSKSKRTSKIYCAPGNGGIAAVAECVPIKADDIEALCEFATLKSIELTFVGGETSLALGIVDEFQRRGRRIIGPSKAAAKLEASKAFAKDFMSVHGIPTAKYVTAHSPGFAILELESGDFGDASKPVVVKADGLAAGKGVVIAKNRAEAITAINEMATLVGTAAADKIVLEECLTGREISLLMFCDSEHFALMPATRDHKRIGEGDTGPNTGGMGTITEGSLVSPDQTNEIIEKIIKPTLRGCAKEDIPFRGVLFIGLMLTADGPKVLEYNVRFGDPETQSILVRLESDLTEVFEAINEERLGGLDVNWCEDASACVVLAARGYPAKPETGAGIEGLDLAAQPDNVVLFHGATSRGAHGEWLTAGGRVMSVTATGQTLD